MAKTFEKWNFPHCVGAIDGKHVVMFAPANSGSIFFNYKRTHSIVLMGISDGDCKFIYVDAGSNGRISDGGVFNKCSFAHALEKGSLHLPQAQPLTGRNVNVPFVFVADDAFALKPYIMKPFSGQNLSKDERVFNYRLSRSRRCIESAFGIMSARIRVMRAPIHLDAAKTRKITLACCALHNFLMTHQIELYAPNEFTDQGNENGSSMFTLESVVTDVKADANKVREEFKQYFMSKDGQLPWQFNYI